MIRQFAGKPRKGTILPVQPTQELFHMPTLITDGGRGQSALVSPISGKIGKPVREERDLRFWHFQRSQKVKPVRSRLNKEFTRPPHAADTLPLLLFTSPVLGGRPQWLTAQWLRLW